MSFLNNNDSGRGLPKELFPTKKILQAGKDSNLRADFIRHVHLNYPEETRARVGELAFRINSFVSDDIYFYFFRELEIACAKFEANSGRLFPPHIQEAGTSWANNLWAYLYPDGVGGSDPNKPSTLNGIADNLDYYMEELGVRVFYLLPLNTSPNRDGRYDVSDYRTVDPLLGGDKAFLRLIREVRRRNGHLVMDMIPAHVSEEHDWFKRAINGDPRYLSYFLTTEDPPKGTLIKGDDGNTWIEYTLYKGEEKETNLHRPGESKSSRNKDNGNKGKDAFNADHDTPQLFNESTQPRGSRESTKLGMKYRRLLLFPDLNKSHWIPEKILVESKETTRWFYSSFFPFQKDLNLQNAEVIREHLETIGHWLSLGVSGIRADAIPWWVKLPGHSGQHADETGFLCELFHRFMKLLNPATVFLPELVESMPMSRHYIGEPAVIGGVKTATRSDTVFAFEKVIHILYAGVTGDFFYWRKHLDETMDLHLPENTRLLLYTGNHHDEIYLGFLPNTSTSYGTKQETGNQRERESQQEGGHQQEEENQQARGNQQREDPRGQPSDYSDLNPAEPVEPYEPAKPHEQTAGVDVGPKKKLQDRILSCGGVIYKSGNSGGAMLSELLEHDPARILSFYKFLLGHYGAVAIYQGTELGLGNAWPHAMKKTTEYLEALKTKGVYDKDHPVFAEIARWKKGDGTLSPENALYPFIDGRLLHRNRITSDMISEAKRGDNEVFNGLKTLLEAREKSLSLKLGGPEEPLNTMRRDIGSFMRRKKDTRNKNMVITRDEVGVVSNGTNEQTGVNLNLKDLTTERTFALWELEQKRNIEFTMNQGFITLTLQPYETLWLQVIRP